MTQCVALSAVIFGGKSFRDDRSEAFQLVTDEPAEMSCRHHEDEAVSLCKSHLLVVDSLEGTGMVL